MDAAALMISHRKIKPAQIFWIPGWVPGASSSPQLTLCSEVTMSERLYSSQGVQSSFHEKQLLASN